MDEANSSRKTSGLAVAEQLKAAVEENEIPATFESPIELVLNLSVAMAGKDSDLERARGFMDLIGGLGADDLALFFESDFLTKARRDLPGGRMSPEFAEYIDVGYGAVFDRLLSLDSGRALDLMRGAMEDESEKADVMIYALGIRPPEEVKGYLDQLGALIPEDMAEEILGLSEGIHAPSKAAERWFVEAEDLDYLLVGEAPADPRGLFPLLAEMDDKDKQKRLHEMSYSVGEAYVKDLIAEIRSSKFEREPEMEVLQVCYERWAEFDPERAMEFAFREDPEPEIVEGVAEEWVVRDPQGFREWLSMTDRGKVSENVLQLEEKLRLPAYLPAEMRVDLAALYGGHPSGKTVRFGDLAEETGREIVREHYRKHDPRLEMGELLELADEMGFDDREKDLWVLSIQRDRGEGTAAMGVCRRECLGHAFSDD